VEGSTKQNVLSEIMENVGSEMETSKYGKYGVGTCPLFEKRTGVFEITFPQRSPETENRKTAKIVRFPLR
jgi:hypothetical protein